MLVVSISMATADNFASAAQANELAAPQATNSVISSAANTTDTNSTSTLPHTNLNASDFNVPIIPATPLTAPGPRITYSPSDLLTNGSPNLPLGSGNQLFNVTSASSYVVTSIDSISQNQMFASSCQTSPCPSFNSFTSPKWGNHYCTSSSTCSVTTSNTRGDLLVVSGSCPGSLSGTNPFTDSLGDTISVATSPSISGEQVGIAYSVLTSSGSNTITLHCSTSGTIGIEFEDITGLGTSINLLSSTGTCTSGCTASIKTSTSITVPRGTNYFAVGVAYASSGSGLATPGAGFTLNEPLYNPLQAAEYSTTVGSSTNFPITDQVTPSQWLDAGVLFVENEQFSYQLNMDIPNCSSCIPTTHNFLSQSTMQFDLVDNYCYAKNGPQYTFTCNSADLAGDSFKWTIQFTSNYFSSTSLYINSALLATWTSVQIFGCSSCASMTDAYLQSVWVGWGGSGQMQGGYANFYDGQGTMQYSGLSPMSCTPSCSGGWQVTGETSNNQFSNPTLSNGVWSQSYYAATVTQVLTGTGHSGNAQIINPSYVIGIPDGSSAEYVATTSGTLAQTFTNFGGTPASYSGHLAIYGYAYTPSSEVAVYCGTTLVYDGYWSSASDQPAWVVIGSVSNCQQLVVDGKDNGSPTNVYIDALSLYN